MIDAGINEFLVERNRGTGRRLPFKWTRKRPVSSPSFATYLATIEEFRRLKSIHELWRADESVLFTHGIEEDSHDHPARVYPRRFTETRGSRNIERSESTVPERKRVDVA